jgi:hypothetical protein
MYMISPPVSSGETASLLSLLQDYVGLISAAAAGYRVVSDVVIWRYRNFKV